jgi:hypothetical protein
MSSSVSIGGGAGSGSFNKKVAPHPAKAGWIRPSLTGGASYNLGIWRRQWLFRAALALAAASGSVC